MFDRSAGGLIPAHAGKTPCPASSHSSRRAHPRSRGENVLTIVGAAVSWGSSPLTRGKRDELLQRLRVRRLIPAHAGKTCFGTLMITILRAHPRSRGENVNAIAGGTKETGSSPLTRGKQLDAASVPNKVGLIPAHAGKTRRTVRRGASAWAHPRSRGENQPVVQPGRLSRGSSPLTRGKPAGRAAGQAVAGLIPAHAGKTSSQRRSPTMRRAHPRSRGENGHGRREHLRPRGSSPLTRGKPGMSVRSQTVRGLIPAHAGKTSE